MENEKVLRIAIQKSGRLYEDSVQLLKECGIELRNVKDRLRTVSENFPIEVFFLRDDDIPEYVEDGVADIGIVGQNVLAEKNRKGVIVLVNKWDLIDKETNTARDYEKVVKDKLAPFTDVPVLFISAVEKTRIFKAIELALEVYENKHRKVPTSKLNDIMLKAILKYQAPVVRGHVIKIKFVSQLPTRVPSFAFFTNFPDDIKVPYRNYLENQLRANFKFTGVPIRVYFRKK